MGEEEERMGEEQEEEEDEEDVGKTKEEFTLKRRGCDHVKKINRAGKLRSLALDFSLSVDNESCFLCTFLVEGRERDRNSRLFGIYSIHVAWG